MRGDVHLENMGMWNSVILFAPFRDDENVYWNVRQGTRRGGANEASSKYIAHCREQRLHAQGSKRLIYKIKAVESRALLYVAAVVVEPAVDLLLRHVLKRGCVAVPATCRREARVPREQA